jgi:hypothetical protein
MPIFIVFIGGSVALPMILRASADRWEHFSTATAPWATFIEKAMQVGMPQSLQFVFGVNLKISRPFNATIFSLKLIPR